MPEHKTKATATAPRHIWPPAPAAFALIALLVGQEVKSQRVEPSPQTEAGAPLRDPLTPLQPPDPVRVSTEASDPSQQAVPFEGLDVTPPRLQGTLLGAHRRFAVIDGAMLGLGGKVDHARIVGITQGNVLLVDDDGHSTRLSLTQGGLP